MGPDSSDLAEILTPGVIFHADSESGLRMGGVRANHPQKWVKVALEMATGTSQHIRPQGVGACLRRRAASATPLQEALGAQKTFEN